jgi:carbamoyl-phosphate synthase large subunit
MMVKTLNSNLLIIGAGIGQVPIIKKAKNKGIHVTVVTQKGNCPGAEFADEVWYEDIYNRDKIVELAKANHITAVTSDQNDLMMPTVAYVAEKLGLPGNTFEQVNCYCNKNNYRDNCDKLGIPVPKHIAVNDIDYDFTEFDCPLPWIVKPADSQSSVGVKRIDSLKELKLALQFALDHSKTHSAIVEEFFVGKEIVCEGFISNGKYYLLSFADRKYFKSDEVLIPSQTLFPSMIKKELLDRVVEYESRMAKHVGISFAIVHSEYLINEETKEIRVVESAVRGGGVYISSHLIPYATGIDVNDLLLRKALGEEVDVDAVFANKKISAAGYVCFYLPEGVISAIEGIDDVERLPFIKLSCLDDISIGQKTEKLLHKGMRKGPLLVVGENRSNLENNIKELQKTLNIKIITADQHNDKIVWC